MQRSAKICEDVVLNNNNAANTSGATCANDTSDATDAGDASGMQTMQAQRSNARHASYANDVKRRVQNARSASFKMTCIGESERTEEVEE